MLLALTNGSRFGVRASLPGVLGAVLSDLVLISAVALGLGALLAASAFWFSVVKWVGVAYLAYLGIGLLRSKGSLTLPTDTAPLQRSSRRAIFLRSFLIAVTNPKGYLFFSAFLPQFIDPSASQLAQYGALTLTFVSLDVVMMLVYAAAGAQAITVLKARGVLWLDRISGGALLALAGSLACYRRAA